METESFAFDELFNFLNEINLDIIELIKRAMGSVSLEVINFKNMRQTMALCETPNEAVLQMAESTFRSCMPTVLHMVYPDKRLELERDKLLFDVRLILAQLNAEYASKNYERFAEVFEKGLQLSIEDCDERRCTEIRRLITLILRTWDGCADRLREKRHVRAIEINEKQKSNPMVVNKQSQRQGEQLNVLEQLYHDINFAQLGLAAYNVNEYATAVFYLEESLQRSVTYAPGGHNGEYKEFMATKNDLTIDRQRVLDLIACAYFQLCHNDQVAAFKKLGAKLDKIDQIEQFDTLRSGSHWHTTLDMFGGSMRFKDGQMYDRAVESAIELSKWDEAEEMHEARVQEHPERQNMSFEFHGNDLVLGMRRALTIKRTDQRNKLVEELERRLQRVELSMPLSMLYDNTIERHRNRSAVQRCLLDDIDTLLKWMKTPENREELEEQVFAEWDFKRNFFKLSDQSYLLEKECTFLDVLANCPLFNTTTEHHGLATLSTTLLAIAHLTRSAISAKRGDAVAALSQMQKSRHFAAHDEAFKWDIALEEARQSRIFNQQERIAAAYVNLEELCSNERLTDLRRSSSRYSSHETIAECFIQLARFTSRYDFDVGGMNRLQVDAISVTEISRTRFRKTTAYLDSAIKNARTAQNGAKCTAHYRYGLYLESHFRGPEKSSWTRAMLQLRNFAASNTKVRADDIEKQRRWRHEFSKSQMSCIKMVPLALDNYCNSILSGNKHAEDCLYKIIGMVFEVADVVRDTISLCAAKSEKLGGTNFHFEMETAVFDMFAEVFDRLPKENGLYLLSQLLGRLATPCPELERALKRVLTSIFDEYPDQVMWNILDTTMRGSSTEEEKERSKKEIEIAKKMAKVVDDIFAKNVEQKALEKYRSYLALGKHLKGFMAMTQHDLPKHCSKFDIDEKYPQLNRFLRKESKQGRHFLVPLKAFIVPDLNQEPKDKVDTFKDYQTTTHSQVQERKRVSYQIKCVTIVSIEADCQLMRSMQRPVKFTIVASNGQRYSFLAKTGDEMSLDARVSELIQMFDFLLRTTETTRTHRLSVRSFYVIPLGHKRGLIEWVNDLAPFKACLEPLFYNKKGNGNQIQQVKRENFRTTELYRKTCRDEYDKVLRQMGPPVFHKWFVEHFNSMNDMLNARRTYASSLAVMSIIGNIIGLGDRHCENIQICQKSGEVVHIDLNMIFERGGNLRVPEIVPFRMTREIVDGCGMAKLDGTFRTVLCDFLRQ